ncbi:MAG: hypothetical protein WCV67_03145 [Victivallaceae bacterium]|jgi:hypothetical protein
MNIIFNLLSCFSRFLLAAQPHTFRLRRYFSRFSRFPVPLLAAVCLLALTLLLFTGGAKVTDLVYNTDTHVCDAYVNFTQMYENGIRPRSERALIWAQFASYQQNLGFTPENAANKSADVDTDKTSTVKYPTTKAVFDYVAAHSGGAYSIHTLGTSGTITVDRSVSDKFTIAPAGAVTLADAGFTDLLSAELQVTNGSAYVSYPVTWTWTTAIPTLGVAGYDYATGAAADSFTMLLLKKVNGKIYVTPEITYTALPAAAVWLKADAISGNNNDLISSWTDSSGNSKTATQSTEANQPCLKTNVLNGKPAVYFDGSRYLNIPAFTASAITYYIVIKKDTTNQGGLWCMGNDAGGSGTWMTYGGTIYESAGCATRHDSISIGATTLTDFNIYSVKSSGSLYEVAMNKNVLFTTTSNTVQLSSSPVLGYSNGGLAYAFTGYIAEFIAVPKAVSSAENTAFLNYLSVKYGITL